MNIFLTNFVNFKFSSLKTVPFKVLENNNVIEIDFNFFPSIEKNNVHFEQNRRFLINKITKFLIMENPVIIVKKNEMFLFEGLLSFICYYIEVRLFKNENQIMESIFEDYSNNKNKHIHVWMWMICDIVKSSKPFLKDLLYLKTVINLFFCTPFCIANIIKKCGTFEDAIQIKNQIIDFVKGDSAYPTINIEVDNLLQEHIYYLNLRVTISNLPNSCKKILPLECIIKERVGKKHMVFQCEPGKKIN